jgi:crossover junction endodeoxyribonuclease RusA
MALAKAKKSYKEACMWQSKANGLKPMTVDALHLTITFVPPDRRHRDLDNMLSSIKAGLDALRDVLGVDDSRWSLTICKADSVGGFVRVEVSHA